MAMQMPGGPMDPGMEEIPPELMGGPPPMLGEPLSPDMPPAPEAMDSEAAAMQIAELLGGLVADAQRKKQALEGIAQAAIMAAMGQMEETLDMPAGTEMAPDPAMMDDAMMAEEALGPPQPGAGY